MTFQKLILFVIARAEPN